MVPSTFAVLLAAALPGRAPNGSRVSRLASVGGRRRNGGLDVPEPLAEGSRDPPGSGADDVDRSDGARRRFGGEQYHTGHDGDEVDQVGEEIAAVHQRCDVRGRREEAVGYGCERREERPRTTVVGSGDRGGRGIGGGADEEDGRGRRGSGRNKRRRTRGRRRQGRASRLHRLALLAPAAVGGAGAGVVPTIAVMGRSAPDTRDDGWRERRSADLADLGAVRQGRRRRHRASLMGRRTSRLIRSTALLSACCAVLSPLRASSISGLMISSSCS